jgi:hypothetical protein
VEGIELLLEGGRAPEPTLTIAHAWRREAAAVSHFGAIPRRVSPRVRTPSTPALFCPKNPMSLCPRELESGAPVSPQWHRHVEHVCRPCRQGLM